MTAEKAISVARRAAMVWLVDCGLTSVQVARAFETYDGRVRNAVYWARRRPLLRPRFLTLPAQVRAVADDICRALPDTYQLNAEFLDLLRIRLDPSLYESPDPSHLQRVDTLRRDIELTRVRNERALRLERGLRELGRIRQRFGRYRSAEARRVQARSYEHATWFAVQLGRSATALRFALRGMISYQAARMEDASRNPEDLKGIADLALAASNACLQLGDSLTARGLLRVFCATSHHAGNTIGGEFYRQLGMLQLSEERTPDEYAAKRYFAKAMDAMRVVGESNDEGHIALWGQRQLNLLTGSWTGGSNCAQALWEAAAERSEQHPVRTAVTGIWSAACALSTDSPHAWDEGLSVLARLASVTERLPKQDITRRLLTSTVRLPLTHRQRREWVRFALTLNPYRLS